MHSRRLCLEIEAFLEEPRAALSTAVVDFKGSEEKPGLVTWGLSCRFTEWWVLDRGPWTAWHLKSAC